MVSSFSNCSLAKHFLGLKTEAFLKVQYEGYEFQNLESYCGHLLKMLPASIFISSWRSQFNVGWYHNQKKGPVDSLINIKPV